MTALSRRFLTRHGLKRARQSLASFRKQFPLTPRSDLDQCPATDDTVGHRLALIVSLLPRRDGHVVLLGDDDLLAVALSASGVPAHVTVVDEDQRLLDALNGFAVSS